MDEWDERLSRQINARLGGDPGEKLCARAYRERRWVVVVLLDLLFIAWRRDGHCHRQYQEHQARWTGDPVERARRAGM